MVKKTKLEKSNFVALRCVKLRIGLDLRKERRDGGVDVANAAEGRTRGHELAVGNHEVGVAVEVVKLLQSGDDVVHEVVDLAVRVDGSKLCQPDGLIAAGVSGSVEVAEEGLGVLGLRVPVDVAEINLAALSGVTGRHELLQPVDALVLRAAVGHGRRTDEDAVTILAHVLGVCSGSGSGGHVGLAGHVRLVEAEEGLGAILDGSLSVLVPVAGVDGQITPEHGDELCVGVQARGRRAPVVGPATVLVASRGKGVGHVGVVVSDTTLSEAERASAGGLVGSSLGLAGEQVTQAKVIDEAVALGLGSLDQGGRSSRRSLSRRSLSRRSRWLSNDGRGHDGSLVGDKLRLGGLDLGVMGNVDGLVHSLPDDAALLSLVVSMAVGVEGLSLADNGGENGKGGDGVGVHLVGLRGCRSLKRCCCKCPVSLGLLV